MGGTNQYQESGDRCNSKTSGKIEVTMERKYRFSIAERIVL